MEFEHVENVPTSPVFFRSGSCQPSPPAGLLIARFKIDGYKKVAGQSQGEFRQRIAD